MHVLLLLNHYPLSNQVHHGVKFRQHVDHYKRKNYNVTVWACKQVIYNDFFSRPRFSKFAASGTDYETPIIHDFLWDLIEKKFRLSYNFFPIINNAQKVRLAARLFEKIESKYGRPDIIHAHGSHWAGCVASEISRRYGLPYVLSEHMSHFDRKLVSLQNNNIRTALTDAKKILPINSSLGATLEAFMGHKLPVRVIPNMLDCAAFSVSHVARAKPRFFTFFSLGRFVSVKRFDLLLRAFAFAFSGNQNIKLRVGGFGPEESMLRHLAFKLGIAQQIKWLGPLSRPAVEAEMNYCDCYVLSSDYETFGIPLIEAAFCGKPVIATDAPGPSDIVTKDSGFLIPKGSQRLFQIAMANMVEKVETFDANTIRKQAVLKYSCESVINQITGIYHEVLN